MARQETDAHTDSRPLNGAWAMQAPRPTRDAALLLARLLLGVILMAHGWQKLGDPGLAASAAGFAEMGVPLPQIAAAIAGVIELLGGLMLLLGAWTSIASVAVILVMLGAYVFAHIGNGIMVTEGGWELVGAIAAGAAALAAAGPGMWSVDGARGGRTIRA